jgi:hypothetical protein
MMTNFAPKMVDGHIRYPDGRQAALEVTTIADPAEMQSAAMLSKDRHKWPVEGVHWTSFVTVRGSVNHKRLKATLSTLLRSCESMGITHTTDMRFWDSRLSIAAPEVLDWIHARALQLNADPQLPNTGTVWVLNDGIFAFVPSLAVMPPWISTQLATPAIKENIDKLAADGLSETHLFVWVHLHGAPAEVVFALLDGEGSPGAAPVLPNELNWIWIAADGAPAFWAWSKLTG